MGIDLDKINEKVEQNSKGSMMVEHQEDINQEKETHTEDKIEEKTTQKPSLEEKVDVYQLATNQNIMKTQLDELRKKHEHTDKYSLKARFPKFLGFLMIANFIFSVIALAISMNLLTV